MTWRRVRNRLQLAWTLAEGIVQYNVLSRFRPLAPQHLQINVTYRCNSRCRMCHIWQMKPQNELTLDEWRSMMKDPIFRDIRYLSLAGGEPILHPQLVELTQIFLTAMPRLTSLNLITNGFLPERTAKVAAAISRLVRQRPVHLSIHVSLDGLGKTHDWLRGVPGAFEKTKATILTLKYLKAKYGFGLGVSGLISHPNLREIQKVEQWCRQRQIPFSYQIIGFHDTYVQNMEEKNKLDFRKSDQKALFRLLGKLARRCSFKDPHRCLRAYYWQDMLSLYQGGQRKTPCPFTKDAFVVDSLGDIYYCLSQPKIGNWRERGSVSAIYYDPANLARRRQWPKTVCRQCNSGCFVSWGVAKDFHKFAGFLVKQLLKGKILWGNEAEK